MKEALLWSAKTEMKPNFWGLKRERKGVGFSMITGYGSSDSPGPLASIIWTLMGAGLSGGLLAFYSIPIALVYISGWIIFILYWFVVREIKYYQLAKYTEYKLYKSKIVIETKFFGKSKKLIIQIKDISNVHLVKYEEDKEVKGSIWIYTKNEINAYDLNKRERNNIPKVEMISDYKNLFNPLQKLLVENKNHNGNKT